MEGRLANMDAASDIRATARIFAPKRIGKLTESIDASYDGDDALVGPTDSAASKNGPYGRAAELGGMRFAHNPSGYMWWPDGNGGLRRARANMMPAQPYLKPAVEEAVHSGELERIYLEHWRKAQEAF